MNIFWPSPASAVNSAPPVIRSGEKVFDALEWLAAMCSHIPDRGKQMVRYYGYYCNVCRGKRKETEDDRVPAILEADKSSKEYRKNWARLIQKIGACPRLDRGRSIP